MVGTLGQDVRPPTTRTKVLVLATTFPRTPGDGTSEFVLSLAQALDEEFDFTILVPQIPGAPSEQRIGPIDVKRFRYFPRRWTGVADGAILPNVKRQPWRVAELPFLFLGMLLVTWRLIRQTRPDLIHAHWFVPAGLVATLLQTLGGPPFVVTAHGADVYALKGRWFDRLRSWIADRASVVSPVSDDLASQVDICPTDRSEYVVPMGVDVRAIQGVASARRPRRERFVFIGRLADKKGIDTLVRAVRSLHRGEVRIIGAGPEGDKLRALVDELALSDRVVFLGQQRRHRVFEELAEAAALVVPSRVAADGDQDGMPVVIAEAAAVGVPVIASALGGITEQLTSGKDSLLVSPDSPAELARAMRWVLEHPNDAERLGSNLRDAASARFGIAHTASRYRRFYRKATGT